jgi:uncharacterized protein (TIGR02118 family)
MVKLVILYPHPADEANFENGYADNLAMLERLPGLIRRQANMVLGGPGGKANYYRILELYFEDYPALESALTSEHGKEAGRDLMKYTAGQAELLFVDVFEDNTPPQN